MADDSAENLRQLGNAHYAKKEFEKAVECYTLAISKNPVDMLHILYSNRSAARVALGKVEEALSDASECIKLKPDFPKGYTRRAECLLRMKRYSEAIEAYEKALALEPTNSVAKEGKSRCLAAISNAKYAEFYKEATKNLDVAVRFIDEVQGKGLIALKDIPEGTVIFREKPLICMQWTSSRTTALCCQQCLRFLGSLENQCAYMLGLERYDPLPMSELYYSSEGITIPVFCEKCMYTAYCSEKCRELARETHHEVLCPYPNSKAATFMHYCQSEQCDRFMLAAQLIVSIILKMKKFNQTFEEASKFISLFQKASWIQILSNQIEDSQKRASEMKKLQDTLKLAHSLFKATLAEALAPFSDDAYSEALSLEFYDNILGMLQLNNPRIEITSPLYRYCGMVAATSGGAGIVASNPGLRNLFTELNKRFEGIPPSCNGEGLFTLHSCMNHSCNANAKQVIPEDCTDAEIAVVATRRIRRGEQITISYIDTHSKNTAERRAELKKYYLFDCTCERCLKGEE